MDKKITEMGNLPVLTGTELIPLVDLNELLPSNQNKYSTFNTIKTNILNSVTSPTHRATHVVGGTDAFLATDLLNAIARTNILDTGVLVGSRRQINFIEGSNVTISYSDDNINEKVDITINASNSGGDVTNASNQGVGVGQLFINKTAGILNLKTISGSGAISITNNANEIVISAPVNSGEANTMTNVGTGLGIYKQKVGVQFEQKSIIGGSNVTLANNPDDITINVSNPTNGANIGGGFESFINKVGDILRYRTFTSSGSVTITQVGDTLNIDGAAPIYTFANLGGGQNIYKNTIGNTVNLRTIVAGSGVLVTTVGDTIEVSSTTSPEDVQDIVGAMLTDSSTIDFVYNDAGNTLTANIITNSVTNTLLAQAPANTIKSNPTNAVANEQDLAIGNNAGIGRLGTGNLQSIAFQEVIVDDVVIVAGVGTYTDARILTSSKVVGYTLGLGGTWSSNPFIPDLTVVGQVTFDNGQVGNNGTLSFILYI